MKRHGGPCDCPMCSEISDIKTVLAVAVVVIATAFCIAVGARDGLFRFFASSHF